MILKFKKMSEESPELYYVYRVKLFKLEKVATIQIRFGLLSVYYRETREEIYSYDFNLWNKNKFYNKEERKKYLNIAKEEINKYYDIYDTFIEDEEDDDIFPFID